MTYGSYKQWGGLGMCKFPTGVSFTWNLWGNAMGVSSGRVGYVLLSLSSAVTLSIA